MTSRARDQLDTGSGQRRPRWRAMRLLRPLARLLVRRWFRVECHGVNRVPAEGPVIFASNHVGLVDGPLLAIFAPRPVHVLTKSDMFRGLLGVFLAAVGQIRLERRAVDPSALRTSVAALRHGGAVGVFPEGTRGAGDLRRSRGGAAYLALVTGAPVVPVTMIGTRDPDGGSNNVPGRGARFDIVFGEPLRLDPVPWPRTREGTDRVRRVLHEHLCTSLQQALELTGRSLPGPVSSRGAQVRPTAPHTRSDEGACG